MGFWAELKRRNVIRVAIAYAVVSWLLIEVASLTFDAFEAPTWAIKLFISFAALGFPFAVFFAWAFELTPDGIKREREVDRSQSVTGHTGRKLDFIIIGVLSVVIVVLLAERFLVTDSGPPTPVAETADRPPSLAVLPFVNMSGNADNEYFADGISEELLNLLAAIDGLRVPSRTSSFAFKGQNRPIGEIARELQVAHVLEGSVRRAGNRVRVTAQLIDVGTDTHLWSDTYDRELEDIFAIQDDISRRIVKALRLALAGDLPERAQPTANMEAHELYLRGLHRFRNRGELTLMRAVDALEEAVELDPQFARAWEALAMVYIVLPGYQTTEEADRIGPELALQRAEKAAERALSLKPALADARAVQALAVSQRDLNAGLELFAELVADRPESSSGRLWYGIQLYISGYLRESLPQFQAAVDVDPASAINHDWLARNYMALGENDLALRHVTRGAELGRQSSWVSAATIAKHEGDFKRFRDLVYRWPSSVADRRAAEFLAEADGDRSGQAGLVAELVAVQAESPERMFRGSAYYWLDEPDPYFDHFEADARANNNIWLETLWYPTGRVFRQHPRFREAAEAVGLLALWRQRGWPDLCRPEGNGFTCD